MPQLKLKPTSKPIIAYYADINAKRQAGFWTEGNVSTVFGTLLDYCAKSLGYSLNQQHTAKVGKRTIRFDGAVLNEFQLTYGVWEAKDSADSLKKEIQKKFEAGYPNKNILFQSPDEAILIQNGREVMSANITQPKALIDILTLFFDYTDPVYDEWERAVAEFKIRVPEIAQKLDDIIEKEYKKRRDYTTAFDTFHDLCRAAINPNLSKDAVEEMLIQHILTERIFRKVFNNDKFTSQNIIAKEIEKVVDALTRSAWNREEFLRDLNHFYGAIETTASTISDYNEKQAFLNTVYEQFFQGFSVDVADTHGIVYTPQPIVQFMVKSVEQLLEREFGRSLADSGVHILDPFVGTGNFLLRVMEEIRQIKPDALPHKYAHELHCNEIMLLPYYIASMNIEHAYYEAMNDYQPFEGICLVDTFELAEARQMGLFTQENLERVERQRKAPLTVIIGNPPYNAWQVNENDNNKNRKYPVIDGRIKETYVKFSDARNKSALSDPYVKAFRWASDRIGDEGVIAFVTNNSFIDNIPFDGMRYYLAREFSKIYVIDLKGNIRQDSMRDGIPLGEAHTVFGLGAMVGVSITFLVKKKDHANTEILYYGVDWRSKRQEKFDILQEANTLQQLTWTKIIPTIKNLWLTEGMDDDYESLLPLGTKEAKKGKGQAIFEIFSQGIQTNRDSWIYNYNQHELQENIMRLIETYNAEVDRWNNRVKRDISLDNFVLSDETRIKWSSSLKEYLVRGRKATYDESRFRISLYRPFQKSYFYFDTVLNHRQGHFQNIFPTPATERENRVICITNHSQIPFLVQMSNCMPSLDVGGRAGQCFSLYVYDPDGTNRRDNISDWALKEYQKQYGDSSITKSDIFYSIYALLHHPVYRERYAQNLKRELPRVPFIRGVQNSPHPLDQNSPHPLAPSPLHEEGEQGSDGGNKGFSLPLRSGGRVGDGGGFRSNEQNPHPLTPSPLHEEGEQIGDGGNNAFSLPLQSGGRVGDGGGFGSNEQNPHPLTPSPLHEEGEQGSDGGNTGFSLPLQSGGRVGDGGGFYSRTTNAMWEILKPLARQMRQNPTPAEAHLWKFINKNQILGKRFRRQHPIDRFIVDFYCHEARLVVEVDGDIHFYTQEEDAIRQAFLESLGLQVIRFSNDAVLNDTERVIREIEEIVKNPQNNPHPLTPSPLHEEGEQIGDGGNNAFSLPLQSGGRVGDGGWFEDKIAFHTLAKLGRDLSQLHLNYEHESEYPLVHVQNPKVPPSLRVEVMRLNKDKTALVVNESLTLTGIPARVYDYKLGNRSALEWVIDQYRVSEDKRSGIINDPNRGDDAGYIVRLVKQVVQISLETLKIVDEIAKMEF